MRSFFASYSYWICPIISWKSLLICNLVAANVRARSSPTRTISYFASLLEVKKLRRIACSTSSLVGDCKIRPILDLDALDALSTWSVHHCSLEDSAGCVIFWGSSAIKSAITCLLYDNLSWYLIPYSLNSMTHFNISLDRSGLCRVTRSG